MMNTQTQTLLDDIQHWATYTPNDPWLIEDWSQGKQVINWQQGVQSIRHASAWLAQHITAGSRVGLLSNNCAHWVLSDLAIMGSGNVTVPLFTTMSPEVFEYVSEFSNISTLFLGPAANWEQVQDTLPKDIAIVRLPGAPKVSAKRVYEWQDIVAIGACLAPAPKVDSDNLATIIFTSGTTGKPKGVMHSLNSLRAGGLSSGEVMQANQQGRALSYLPLAHVGERNVVEVTSAIFGVSVYFNENLSTFLDDMKKAQPTFFMGVPRIWENLQKAVQGHLDTLSDTIKSDPAALKKASREFLGLDNCQYILTSTAATATPLKQWFEQLGLTLHDAYGQTELLPITANRIGFHKAHSIGQAAPGVEVKISQQGEIQARSRATSLGYYKMPEVSANTIQAQGWVCTGDKGFIDDDQHIIITGRIKEIFKTGKGKYVAPAPIEGLFLDHPFIDQVCLTGSGQPQTIMLAVLSHAAQAAPVDQVQDALLKHLARINDGVEKHAAMGALIITHTPWTQENGLLTHTMKMKRSDVEKHFNKDIEEAGVRMREGGKQPIILAPQTTS